MRKVRRAKQLLLHVVYRGVKVRNLPTFLTFSQKLGDNFLLKFFLIGIRRCGAGKNDYNIFDLSGSLKGPGNLIAKPLNDHVKVRVSHSQKTLPPVNTGPPLYRILFFINERFNFSFN